MFEVKKKRKHYSRISREQFDAIDTDCDGHLSRFEFVSFVLVQYGIAKPEDLTEISAQFDHLDAYGNLHNYLIYPGGA